MQCLVKQGMESIRANLLLGNYSISKSPCFSFIGKNFTKRCKLTCMEVHESYQQYLAPKNNFYFSADAKLFIVDIIARYM